MTTADRMTKEMLALDRAKGKRKECCANKLTHIDNLINTAIAIIICLSTMVVVCVFGMCIALSALGIL